ncbi:MAG: glycosyltransferase family 4 protein [Candidatus Yanofskybacteria bacterium]|nr:glycosyltransferase family 4 protein [Candidatus Yanofskybacteria bacterium]
MRILIFTTAFRPLVGGSEIAIEHIAQRLPGVFFDIVTPRYNKKFSLYEQHKNITVHRVGFGSILDKWLFPITGAWEGYKLRRFNVYRIIHGYQASYASGAAWLVKKFNPSLRFIVTLQEGKPLEKGNPAIRLLRSVILKKADHITVISRYLGKFAAQFKKPTTLIPNGVALEIFNSQNSPINPRKRIITVSRLVPKNGVENLIRAMALLSLSHDFELVVVGDGELKDKFIQLTRQLNISDNVDFVGSVDHKEVAKLLSQSDVFVRPSLSEGLGSAFLEAMACGIPVVGSQIGGIPDFLTHGETGLFCDPHKPDDIAQKIELILSDGLLRDRIIRQGLILVQTNYSWDKIAERMNQIYQSMV